MNNLIIIQARTSSTRLPGKVLMPFVGSKSILDVQLTKIKQLQVPVVLATTTNPDDDVLVEWAEQNGVEVFRGDEFNVLQRFVQCSHYFGAEQIIRVCSDNPFLQLGAIPLFFERLTAGADYVSFADNTGVPAIRKHWGLFVEGIKTSALEKSMRLVQDLAEGDFFKEHVTNYIYGNPDQFTVELLSAPKSIIERNDLRFTIDTIEDFNNMRSLMELNRALSGDRLEDLISLVDKQPLVIEEMKKGIKKFDK